MLEVGCGAGVDLARFAKGGANVVGVDLASSAIDLARANFEQQGLTGDFRVADGEALPFPDDSFDLVYAHGVVQYTANPQRLVDECRRVLKPGGEAVFQVYNRVSWLNALSKLMKVGLEHDDAPVLLKFSIGGVQSACVRAFAKSASCRSGFPSRRGCTAAGRARSTTASSSGRSTRCRDRSCSASAGTCWRSAASDR